MKTEQEALEFFCNHFNLYINSMDYVRDESGYYCRFKADGPHHWKCSKHGDMYVWE